MTSSDHTLTAGAALAELSRHVESDELPRLSIFDAPSSLTTVRLRVGQLGKICPASGRPDHFSLDLSYVPAGGRCLEIASFVRYLEAFHRLAVSAEILADQVAATVLEVTGAAQVEVTVHQTGREGGEIEVTARHPTAATHSDRPELQDGTPAKRNAREDPDGM